MSNDLERAFAALSSDAERGLLLSGAELRRQAARRQNRRVAVTAGAAAVLAVAAIGTGWALAGDGNRRTVLPPAVSAGPSWTSPAPSSAPPSSAAPSSAPPSTAPPPSSPPATTIAPAIPKSVPARAMLNKTDTHSDDFARLDEPEDLPTFCSKAKFPSRDLAGVSASVRSFYRSPDAEPGSIPDDTLYNTVTVYRSEGAQDFMAQLRKAVSLCPTGKVGDREAQYDSRGSLGLGDDSTLIERSYEATGGDGEPLNNGSRTATYIAAVRVNDAITLIDTRGYENLPSDRAAVEALARKAAGHLADWR